MSVLSMISRRTLIIATSAMLALPALPASLASAQEKTSVRAALTQEPDSLDPVFDTNLPALNIFYNVFDQLVGIDETGAVVPLLASDWSASDDLKTWTFTLREGATFHDGSPVTAEDVLFTFETGRTATGSRVGGYLTTIDSVTAEGNTITFNLNVPYAPFDRQVSLVPILSKAAYESMGAEAYARKPVGSGPYSVVNWAGGDAITLKRYDGYWGDKGTFEDVVFEIVPDETTRANSVQSGDLDIALLGPASVPAVEGSGAVDVVNQTSNRVVYLGFNAGHPWLDDVNIRKAIDMAIDRTTLGERLLNGAVTPTSQLVAAVTFGHDEAIPATEFDLEEARKLVEASGYDGTPIPLSYPNAGLPQIDQVAQAIAFFLGEAGLKIELDQQEANTYFNAWYGVQLKGLYIFAFAPTVMDADLPLTMLLRTGAQGYNPNPEIDALLDQEIGEADEAKRAAIFSEISQLVNRDTSYAPLFIDTYTYGVTKGLDWTPRPDGLIVLN
jgi:peptide/nickel transport system substrate-binding protein